MTENLKKNYELGVSIYRSLLANMKDGACLINLYGTITFVNNYMAELLGYSERNLLGRSIFSLMDKTALEMEAAQKIKSRMIIATFSSQEFIHKDGHRVYTLIKTIPLSYPSDQADELALALIDVSKREKLVEALKQSEEQFRRIVEDAPVPTIVQAEDGEVIQISQSWTRLTGYSLNEIRPFDEWITTAVYGEGANEVRDYLRELFKGDRESIGVDFEVKTATGEMRCWSFSASSPGTLLDGRRFIVGMAVDVTEQRRAEQLILDARDYAESIVSTVREPLVVLDGDLKVVSANNSFYQTFKVTQENTRNRLLYDLGNRQWDIPKLRKLLEDILPTSSVINDFEVTHNFPDIGEKTMLLNARKMVQRDKSQPMILLAIEDITERKKLEVENKAYTERLEKSVESKRKTT